MTVSDCLALDSGGAASWEFVHCVRIVLYYLAFRVILSHFTQISSKGSNEGGRRARNAGVEAVFDPTIVHLDHMVDAREYAFAGG